MDSALAVAISIAAPPRPSDWSFPAGGELCFFVFVSFRFVFFGFRSLERARVCVPSIHLFANRRWPNKQTRKTIGPLSELGSLRDRSTSIPTTRTAFAHNNAHNNQPSKPTTFDIDTRHTEQLPADGRRQAEREKAEAERRPVGEWKSQLRRLAAAHAAAARMAISIANHYYPDLNGGSLASAVDNNTASRIGSAGGTGGATIFGPLGGFLHHSNHSFESALLHDPMEFGLNTIDEVSVFRRRNWNGMNGWTERRSETILCDQLTEHEYGYCSVMNSETRFVWYQTEQEPDRISVLYNNVFNYTKLLANERCVGWIDNIVHNLYLILSWCDLLITCFNKFRAYHFIYC